VAETVTLEFLGRQFERVFAQLSAIRDEQSAICGDLTVLTSIVLRQDATLNGIVGQLHALTARHNRFDIRLRRLGSAGEPVTTATCVD
jgi:hypothetical protein